MFGQVVGEGAQGRVTPCAPSFSKVRCIRPDTSRSDNLLGRASSSGSHGHRLDLKHGIPSWRRLNLTEPAERPVRADTIASVN